MLFKLYGFVGGFKIFKGIIVNLFLGTHLLIFEIVFINNRLESFLVLGTNNYIKVILWIEFVLIKDLVLNRANLLFEFLHILLLKYIVFLQKFVFFSFSLHLIFNFLDLSITFIDSFDIGLLDSKHVFILFGFFQKLFDSFVLFCVSLEVINGLF